MKKKLILVCAALMCTVALMAQNISVVSSGGSTKLYRTLQAAIKGADPNSVIYLPGGGFPIADSVKITKKLTIIGIGHKIKTENPDGYTTISGNLFFDNGSDESALMGCYVTGTVNIGQDGNAVNDVLIRCNNMYRVIVDNNRCMGTIINQNYIREDAKFAGASATFSNNIADSVWDLDDGYISNNIIIGVANIGDDHYNRNKAFRVCDRTSITNNIIMTDASYCHSGNDCFASGNMCRFDWGDDCINVNKDGFDWKNVFKDYQGVSATSNFHFKEEYAEYEGKVGIYAGDSFNDKQLAPVPYIVAKKIPEQTDASGKLNVKIRVKAGE